MASNSKKGGKTDGNPSRKTKSSRGQAKPHHVDDDDDKLSMAPPTVSTRYNLSERNNPEKKKARGGTSVDKANKLSDGGVSLAPSTPATRSYLTERNKTKKTESSADDTKHSQDKVNSVDLDEAKRKNGNQEQNLNNTGYTGSISSSSSRSHYTAVEPPALLPEQQNHQTVTRPGAYQVQGINGVNVLDDGDGNDTIMYGATTDEDDTTLPTNNDDSTGHQEFIANASLVNPEEEKERIIQSFVKMAPQGIIVEPQEIPAPEPSRWFCKKRTIFLVIALVCILVAALVSVLIVTTRPSDTGEQLSEEEQLLNLFSKVSSRDDLLEDGSPQNWAYSWLLNEEDFVYSRQEESTIMERYIALVFYVSTMGWYWSNDLNFASNSSICEWHNEDKRTSKIIGFECNKDDEVVLVTADNNNISGTLPSELFQLPSIREIRLNNNKLRGTIPLNYMGDAKVELNNLAILDLSSNYFNGTIPSILMASKTLRILDLRFNQLNGTIPDFETFLGYREIHLADNDLSGSIPESISKLTSLSVMNLKSNNINGTIPAGIKDMSNLEKLYLEYNDLSGSIPHQVQYLYDMTKLNLQGNQLNGTIPKNLADLEKLTEINLRNNQLSGTLPRNLASITNLASLTLTNNRLTGTIPTDLFSLTKLTVIDVGQNGIIDSLDESLCASETKSVPFVSADCRGLTPKVKCSCCNRCYDDSGSYVDNSTMCKFDSFIKNRIQSTLDIALDCDCINGGRLLACYASSGGVCKACNADETSCAIFDNPTFELQPYANDNAVVIVSIDTKYVKGSNRTVSIRSHANIGSFCEVEVDSEKCESCRINECGSIEGKRAPQISCGNVGGVLNYYDGCADLPANEAGVFEVLTWIMKRTLFSEESCYFPNIFDVTSFLLGGF